MDKNSEISLKEFSEEHITQTFIWVKEPEFQKLFLMRGEINWDGHLAYFKKCLNDSLQCIYAIYLNSLHVGNCGLKNLDISKKTGELWIYVGDSQFRSQGIGQKATRMLIEFAFNNLKLDSIYLHVADFNLPACRVYEKLGFIQVQMDSDADEWQDRGINIIRMEKRKY